RVMDLIYWKDTERTGMVFTGLVVGLLSLFQLSIITVISTISLGALCFTVSVSLYYKILHVLNMGDGVPPFNLMEFAMLYCREYIQIVRCVCGAHCVSSCSSQLLALMYLVTFLGDLCNGLTVLIIGVIALFSLPLVYRQHQAKVDGFVAGIQANVDNAKDILHRIAQGGGPTPDTTPGGAKPKTQ
uniref:Reticulon n=1 Tax=Oncorhynchus tshawytscha TaxID=74940 RepID=A0AAZ3S9X7_ONCTS